MPEQHPPITETTTGAASNGCPVVGHMKYPVEGGGNQDWWPNRLNLKVLHQNPAVADPMGAAFDYAAEVATIDVDALTRDIEEVMTTSQPFVVLGVGLNVTQAPEEVDPDATSLLDLGVAAPDRNRIASRLLRELEARIIQWRNANPQLAADYRARSLTIGSRVRVELPGGQDVVGIARDIDDQGRLCLDVGGRTVVVSAGDVVHLR